MSYEQLLDKVYKDIKVVAGTGERFEVPKVEGQVAGKNTVITNIVQIADYLRRDVNHLSKFLQKELEVAGRLENNRLVLKTKLNSSKVNDKVERYAKEFVVCPVCGKNLTSGVMSRVKALTVSDIESKNEADKFGVRWMKDRKGKRPPYVMLVPLLEIIAESLHSTVSSQKVMAVYDRLINSFSNEFEILLKTNLTDLKRITTDRVVEGVKRVRSGDIVIDPGYDGVFGKVKIWKTGIDQETLF